MEILWQLFLGLAIFMYGMLQIESGLGEIGRRKLKRWITDYTSNRFSSVGVGIGVTAVLQSSSLVSLLVLAFASAGAIPLYNAIGVILGANLGTTFTGWIVATLGFEFKLSSIAIPCVAIGGLAHVFFSSHRQLRGAGSFLLGLGLLVFGLNLMKDTVGNLPAHLDLEALRDLPPWAYLLAGTVVTAVVQSSSATMVIVLTALHSNIINLPDAAALVIGADLGSTSTTILGALNGHAIKRQLALSHVLFNVSVDLLAFFVLLPALPYLLTVFEFSNPLYSLVAFHSSFNLLGLMLFIPVLIPFSVWIGGFFQRSPADSQLKDIPTDVPEAALAALKLALQSLIIDATALNLHNLRSHPDQLQQTGLLAERLIDSYREALPFAQRYERIKEQENAITEFAIAMQGKELNISQARTLSLLLAVSRSVVYACKGLKDSREHLATLRHDESRLGSKLYKEHLANQLLLYRHWLPIFFENHTSPYIDEQSDELDKHNQTYERRCEDEVYQSELRQESSDLDRSTLLNINREIYHAGQNFILSLRQWSELQSV